MLGEELEEAISARRRAEEESQEKSEFLANVSHEIRTPLTGILTATELMLMEGPSDDRLEFVLQAAKMLRSLMEDLLDLARVEGAAPDVRAAPFALGDLIETARQAHGPLATKRELDLRFRGQETLPCWVRGDRRRLAQVLSNLVDNAIKYTPSGSVTVVASWAEGSGDG